MNKHNFNFILKIYYLYDIIFNFIKINLNFLQCILRYFCFKNYIDRLKTLMNLEFRSVYHYCFLRGLSPREAHEEMIQAYGEDCPHKQTIRKWYKRFEDGLESFEDANRSGRPKNPSLVPKIEIFYMNIRFYLLDRLPIY